MTEASLKSTRYNFESSRLFYILRNELGKHFPWSIRNPNARRACAQFYSLFSSRNQTHLHHQTVDVLSYRHLRGVSKNYRADEFYISFTAFANTSFPRLSKCALRSTHESYAHTWKSTKSNCHFPVRRWLLVTFNDLLIKSRIIYRAKVQGTLDLFRLLQSKSSSRNHAHGRDRAHNREAIDFCR